MPATLRKGSTGEDVKLCQTRLNAHGFSCKVDGQFGPRTETLVRAFQRATGIKADGVVGGGTWAELLDEVGDIDGDIVDQIKALGAEAVFAEAKRLGHVVWDEANRLWYFGVRSPALTANKFDDALGVIWTGKGGKKHMRVWPGTTDPGTYWLEHPMRVDGTAILVEGQYLDCWKIDLHNGQYRALCQRAGKVKVYRDADKDNVLDFDVSTESGWFGINLHRATANGESTQVNKWSAGCQVTAVTADHGERMELADMQVGRTKRETFSYTLMKQWF